MSMWQSFGVNMLLGVVWGLVQSTRTPFGYLVGLLLGFGIVALVNPAYGRRSLRALAFVFYVAWQIILSAWRVTIVMLGPRRLTQPGIVAVPLDLTTRAEVLILASVITLTPGTISVETGRSAAGRAVLFVHALEAGDPDGLRASIKQDFERRILGFSRGAPVAANRVQEARDDL